MRSSHGRPVVPTLRLPRGRGRGGVAAGPSGSPSSSAVTAVSSSGATSTNSVASGNSRPCPSGTRWPPRRGASRRLTAACSAANSAASFSSFASRSASAASRSAMMRCRLASFSSRSTSVRSNSMSRAFSVTSSICTSSTATSRATHASRDQFNSPRQRVDANVALTDARHRSRSTTTRAAPHGTRPSSGALLPPAT